MPKQPLALLLVSAFPPVPAFTPGVQNLDVPQNGTSSLPVGNHGALVVGQGATITFVGGVYTFADWDIRQNAKLHVMASAEIRIAGRLNASQQVTLAPAPSVTGLSSRDILIVVTGSNDIPTNPHTSQKAVEFGQKSTLVGTIYAPDGTLQFGQKTNATGTFIAKWIIIDQNAELKLE